MIKAMKDFQIPMRVEVDSDAHTPTFGRFTTEAFERGLAPRSVMPSGAFCYRRSRELR